MDVVFIRRKLMEHTKVNGKMVKLMVMV